MSEIRVTTLKDTSGGNSSTTADIYSGRTKAWVNFNGQGTITIRSSFNVNSITDTDVGYYVINFTNALTDANYSAVAGVADDAFCCGTSPAKDTKTTTACSLITRTANGSGRYDSPQVSLEVIR